MPRINGILYSYCGLVCSFCKAFREGECKGCDVHAGVCEFAKCCIRRGLRCCFECKDFPCKLHSEGFIWETEEFGKLKWKVYSDVFLSIFKKAK